VIQTGVGRSCAAAAQKNQRGNSEQQGSVKTTAMEHRQQGPFLISHLILYNITDLGRCHPEILAADPPLFLRNVNPDDTWGLLY
jgi:hypothetical protein